MFGLIYLQERRIGGGRNWADGSHSLSSYSAKLWLLRSGARSGSYFALESDVKRDLQEVPKSHSPVSDKEQLLQTRRALTCTAALRLPPSNADSNFKGGMQLWPCCSGGHKGRAGGVDGVGDAGCGAGACRGTRGEAVLEALPALACVKGVEQSDERKRVACK